MKLFAITGLFESDISYLQRLMRAEFDLEKEAWEDYKDREIIERAQRFGFVELAEEMENDLCVKSLK